MTAYYNEHNPTAAAWLRELIARGLIAPGIVDERSIEDVVPDELARFTQCHFFAGIGGWSLALRQAGWADSRPIWTGSCPCQPFSAAGKGGGFDDERHLWPAFHHLIRVCQPDIVMGEQVASKDGLAWLDLVCADMEGEGYAIGAHDTCAAGFGAAQIRQRLYWGAVRLAHCERIRWPWAFKRGSNELDQRRDQERSQSRFGFGGAIDRMANTSGPRLEGRDARAVGDERQAIERGGGIGGMAHAHGRDASTERQQRGGEQRQQPQDGGAGGVADAIGQRWCRGQGLPSRGIDVGQDAGWLESDYGFIGVSQTSYGSRLPGPTNGFWSNPDWLFCRDDKWRPVRPGSFPLAHGLPARMGRLRGYGNAIVVPQATAIIGSLMDVLEAA